MMRLYPRHFLQQRMIVIISIMLFVLFGAVLMVIKPSESSPIPSKTPIQQTGEFLGDYDWDTTLTPPSSASDYLTYTDYRNNYCLAGTTASACLSAASGKYIRIDTAQELYRFSMDVSYEDVYITGNPTEDVKLSHEKIGVLLSLNYKLGNDIDYSVMGALTFVPIGYYFTDADPVNPTSYDNVFQGTFDGQGFKISNLYVAGYEYMKTDQVISGNTIHVATSAYYSMFNYNEGTIQNLGLINPTLEMQTVHLDINFTSNLVGQNDGIIDHVYVIDNRTNVLDAGIRYNVEITSEDFSAAGIVHTNHGTFTNAYYVSKVVVNGSYINKFEIQPVLFSNVGGTIGQLVYDSDVYLLSVTVGSSTFVIDTPNGYATGEATSVIKAGTTSTLNDSDDLWYFYASDSYPLLLGLDYSDNVYHIDNAIDFVFFGRVISYTTVANGTSYANADYVITDDIDMSTLASGAYVTAQATFNGSLTAEYPSGTTLDQNYYIYELDLTKGIIRSNVYYSGIFSILGSTAYIHDINIANSSISLSDTESYYSYQFNIGVIAGRNSGGTIEAIQTDVSINLGTQAIGETHAGGIVGRSSGNLSQLNVMGSIDAGAHVFSSAYTIVPVYYIGGVVGSASSTQLRLDDVLNQGTVDGFSTTSTPSFSSGYTGFSVKMGGVIGYLLNTSTVKHQLINVSNKGTITVDNIIDSTTPDPTQHVGGVFGELAGNAPTLENGSGDYLFANLYNEGNIVATYSTSVATVRAAGIGVNNASEAVEYALLSNDGQFVLNSTPTNTTNSLFRFTGTIFDVGSSAVTLSRVYNHSNRSYTTGYYTNISPLYYSLNNSATLIRYSANYGDIAYINNGGASTISAVTEITISGITSSTNVNYLNVHNYGDISVVSINLGSYALYVSGITKTLTANKYIKNSLNQGNIVVAQMTGSGNIYVGGIVNSNLAGDIHELGENDPIVATEGIINTINYGYITSTFNSSYYAIDGTNNTFAAGLATLNAGSIQDGANLGNITIFNSANTVSMDINNDADQYFAGLVEGYTGGVTAGGISAVILSGNSRIYDTANNGDVIAVANSYSRSGGVLATALYPEILGGGITSGMGLTDTIEISILSNGLNFGNITAITKNIVSYSSSTTTSDTYTYPYLIYGSGTLYRAVRFYYGTQYVASQERIAIYASAGGVIGYGLCTMSNMLNHGTISSTDVAGGIVGATFALGGSGETTVVNITTAINYGLIKAISVSDFTSIVNDITLTYDELSSYFLDDGNSLIFPSNGDRLEPGSKRGFGGVFGRLQRGNSGVMTSETGAFNFIVNANPNIDLIGRLDQVYNFSSSSRFFRFNDAIYYSARLNDTTQVVFTGFYYVYGTAYRSGATRPYTININPSTMYKEVGIVGTSIGSYTTPYTQLGYGTYCTSGTAPSCSSSSNLSTSSSSPTTQIYAYHSPVEVPWITENPSDPNLTDSDTQYIYDPDFEMRTNPDLTEYIYYMPNELLAERFTSSRAYGMYVLSTSAGSSVGLVLPSNITTDNIKGIDESSTTSPSLLMDYTNVSKSDLASLDSAVLTAYNNLKQTKFNEKSLLIESESTPINLTENVGGSETQLVNGVIDNNNMTVTFTLSMEAFTIGQTTASYSVSQALTSAYALIAVRTVDYYNTSPPPTTLQLESINDLLYPEREDGISTDYPAELTVTLPSRSITTTTQLSIGYITVYSEAFIGDYVGDLYANSNYYTDYEILINFTPTIENIPTGSIGITDVSFNGGGAVSVSNASDVRSNGNVNYNGSIRFYFEDSKGVLTDGYDFSQYMSLQYQGVTVSPSYYTMTAYPTTISGGVGYYSVLFQFTSGQLKSGDYSLYYKYFSSGSQYSVLYDKSASNQTTLSGLSYYSSNGSVVINGSTVSSSVNFGYALPLSTSFSTDTDSGIPIYLTQTTYTPDYMVDGSFIISPFSTLTSVTVGTTTYSSGYKVYTVTYRITAENGSTYVDYVHTITERTIDLTSVLKNGNEVALDQVDAAREDDLTSFTLDLSFDQTLDLYNLSSSTYPYIWINVASVSQPIQGITYDVNDYLMIYMDYTTLPDVYTFTFRVYQDASTYVTISTSLDITKLEGTDSYLKDIRFSELMTGTVYPDISITDTDGEDISTSYDPRVYYAGIDYDGSEGIYYYYRIDGKVSNTPLDQYVPFMIDYLPYGATIAKGTWNSGTSSWDYGTEVAEGGNIAPLVGNFTVDPKTNLPGDAMIPYRVTSEDGLTMTYYYITVTDVTYNVTLTFDIYYCTGVGEETCTLAENTAEFASTLFIITIKNQQVYNDSVLLEVAPYDNNTNPALFPVFDEAGELNNQMSQFYFTNTIDFDYRLGRNMSGFYTFEISLPRDEYLNTLYTYEIKHDIYYLNDASTYDPVLNGMYYYIGYAEYNRTADFDIFIRSVTPSTERPWGLYDFFRSWLD